MGIKAAKNRRKLFGVFFTRDMRLNEARSYQGKWTGPMLFAKRLVKLIAWWPTCMKVYRSKGMYFLPADLRT